MSIAENMNDAQGELQIRTEIEKYAFRVERMVDFAHSYDVCSKLAAEEALSYAVEAKTLFKKLETLRKEITEPARKFVNRVNDTAKIFTEKLEKVEEIIKQKIDIWKHKQEEENQHKKEEAELFAKAMDLSVIPHVDDSSKVIRGEGVTSYEKTEWKFHVEDLCKVPMHFLKIDEEQIKLALRNGVREIPGLKIYSEQKTVIRSR